MSDLRNKDDDHDENVWEFLAGRGREFFCHES